MEEGKAGGGGGGEQRGRRLFEFFAQYFHAVVLNGGCRITPARGGDG